MSHHDILVVDSDPSARGLMLRALDRAGLEAVGAASLPEAQARLALAAPALVFSELAIDGGDGTELVQAVRRRKATAEVPFFFLTARGGLDASDARRLGAQDLLRKPVFIRDVVTLGKLHAGRPAHANVLDGRLESTGPAHLLRALASGGRSGRLVVLAGAGEVAFRDGWIIDAELWGRSGEPALHRLLTLTEGPFHLFFESVGGSGSIAVSVDRLLREGLPHVRRWEQVAATLPPLDARLVVDYAALTRRLGEIPDAVNELLRLCDGHRSIDSVLADSRLPDLVAIEAVAKLQSERVLRPLAPAVEPTFALVPPPTPAADDLLASLIGATDASGGQGALAVPDLIPVGTWDDYERPGRWERILDEATSGVDPEEAPPQDLEAALRQALLESESEAPSLDDAEAGVEMGVLPEPIVADESTPAERPLALQVIGAPPALAPEVVAPVAAPAVLAPVVAPAEPWLTEDAVQEAFFGTEPTVESDAVLPAARWDGWLFLGVFAVVGAIGLSLVLTAGDPAPAAPAATLAAVDLGPIEVAPASVPAAAPRAAPAPAERARALDGAQTAYELGDVEEASLLFAEAAARWPEDVLAHKGLGLSLLDLGEVDDAIAALSEARALDPTDGQTTVFLGTALQLSGRRAEARAAYADYLRAYPEGGFAEEIRRILQTW